MSKKEELNAAPIPDQWYTLTLGSSFKDDPSPKISTLRYDFMPASVDKTQPGSLHRRKDKINVELNHVQPGKPKFNFEGTGETLNENDAVMYFDGSSTFRLERLHRAVNRLKHCRLPGEQHAPLDPTSPSPSPLPSLGRPAPKPNAPSRAPTFTPPRQLPPQMPVSIEVERMDIGEVERLDIGEVERMDIGEVERMDIGEVERIDIGEVERIDIGGKSRNDKSPPPSEHNATISPDFDLEAHLDIMNDDDDDDAFGPDKSAAAFTGIDINLPHQNDTDDEIADVDVNDDNGVMGGNAAAALRALVHKEEKGEETSSSSASSGSESSASSSRSGSGSSQSSSDSDGNSSDGDTVNSI
ncbi:hypothetical protein KSS87_004814 [Heliosperma pusillum]|nr:hypothetical protein KSS87_012615 [Heliosperma pusillum]KAH9617181.1 hypothetical protein KSS87_004814 [Heliosperma pusillum]